MAIEHREGMARPTLPRSSDLLQPPDASDAPPMRDAKGRLLPGARLASERGAKRAIRKALGMATGRKACETVASDAAKVFSVVIREMPSEGAAVRNLAALLARHSAIAGYFGVRADMAGLDTPEGQKALELALQHGQRVERLTVTCLDVATRLARKPVEDAHGALAHALTVEAPKS